MSTERLSPSQQRLWIQLGEMLRPFVAAPEPELPALADAEIVQLTAELECQQEVEGNELGAQAVPMADDRPAPEVLAEPAVESLPETLPVVMEEVASQAKLPGGGGGSLPSAPPPPPDWRTFGRAPVSQFLARIPWKKEMAPGAQPAGVASKPEPAASQAHSELSTHAFFAQLIPWGGRGLAPRPAPGLALAGSAAPSLESMMTLATETALRSAHRLASGTQPGTAVAFFSQITWQRKAA